MRVALDRQKCVDCGLCLEACPQLPERKSLNVLFCDCEEPVCAAVCPKGAIEERINGAYAINKEKCDNCGLCINACPRRALVRQKSFPGKCDCCSGNPACISACPYGALRLERNAQEESALRSMLGWRKVECGVGKEIGSIGGMSICETGAGRFLLTNISEPAYADACAISHAMACLRQGSESWDRGLAEEVLRQCCEEFGLPEEKVPGMLSFVEREMCSFSVLSPLLESDAFEELYVAERQPVRVFSKQLGWLDTDLVIDSRKKALDLVNAMSRRLGRRITLKSPRLSANIDSGRIHAVVSPISLDGVSLTVRRFNRQPFPPQALVGGGTISAEAMAFLWMCMECDLNVLVAGNTGSGKTSTLNSLFSFIPEDERIILVEETPEMSLPHRHLVRLAVCEELGVRMDELVSDTLRMRPDRVVVGEVRSPQEARAFVNTMLAGQGKGSYATFHGQSSREALTRLQSLGVSAADLFALDVIVVQRRWTQRGKLLRRVTEIAVQDSGRLEASYEYDFRGGLLVPRNPFCRKVSERMRATFCLEKRGLRRELERRAEFLGSDPGSYEKALCAIRGYGHV
jgi:Flp pilus assembly CpaF family ATPase/Fe-S-cluster-containing hydrogenase component 2